MPKRSYNQNIHDVVVHKKLSNYWRKEVFKFRNAVAIYAIRNGINKAQLVFQRHFTWISYWKRKYENKNFHSGNWGGA